MTKAQQLGIKNFPYLEKDILGREIYWENEIGYWEKSNFDSKGNKTYWENSRGIGYMKIFDENNKLISEIDIKTWKQIDHRNSVIDNLI